MRYNKIKHEHRWMKFWLGPFIIKTKTTMHHRYESYMAPNRKGKFKKSKKIFVKCYECNNYNKTSQKKCPAVCLPF